MIRKTKEIREIDKLIGSIIYELRIYKGINRKELSMKIGVSIVQLQKYELGINSIAAGRLLMIVKALKEKFNYFEQGIGIGAIHEITTLTQHQRMCLEVSKNFIKIHSLYRRETVNALIKTLAKKLPKQRKSKKVF